MVTLWNFFKSNPAGTVSAVFAALAFGFSIVSFMRTRSATLYSDIDARYLELLKLSIAKPDFVNPALTSEYKRRLQDNDLLAYQQYAFAAWNIAETIFDRRGKRLLRKTWYPVIKEENRLHRTWLNAEENQHKFKKKFWKFILSNKKAFPCPTCMELQQKGQKNSVCTRCRALVALVKSKDEIPVSPRLQLDSNPQVQPIK